jgi:hypothetical protein
VIYRFQSLLSQIIKLYRYNGEDKAFFSVLLDRKEEFSTGLLAAACNGFLFSSSCRSDR